MEEGALGGKWMARTLAGVSAVSHVVCKGSFLILVKGDDLELVRVEENGCLVLVHRQSTFCSIRAFLPFDGFCDDHLLEEECVSAVLASKSGRIAIIRFSVEEGCFITVSLLDFFRPFLSSGTHTLLASKGEFVACGTLHGSIVVHRTSQGIFDPNRLPLTTQLSKGKAHSGITTSLWDMKIISQRDRILLSCLVHRSSGECTLLFFPLDHQTSSQSHLDWSPVLEVDLSQVSDLPYRLCVVPDSQNDILLLTEGAFFLLSSEEGYQVHANDRLSHSEFGKLIEHIQFHPSKPKDFFAITGEGTLLYFQSSRKRVHLVSHEESAGPLQIVRGGHFLLVFGEQSDGKVYQTTLTDSEEVPGQFNLLYEIPNWCPLLDLCSDGQQSIYACGGNHNKAEIFAFRGGVNLENVMSSGSSNGYFSSARAMWSVRIGSSRFIVLSFTHSSRILAVSEDEHMEDVTNQFEFQADQSTVSAGSVPQEGTLIQVISSGVFVSSPSKDHPSASWSCQKSHSGSVINHADVRDSEVLLSISTGNEWWMTYIRVVKSSIGVQLVQVSERRMSYEISCLSLPSSKFSSYPQRVSGPEDLSFTNFALVGTYQPCVEIISLLSPDLGSSATLLLSSSGEESRIHSLCLIAFGVDYTLFIGLRDGEILTAKVGHTASLQELPKVQDEESQDPLMTDFDENWFPLSLSLTLQQRCRAGILPVRLTPIVYNGRPSVFARSNQSWLIVSVEKPQSEVLHMSLIDRAEISALSEHLSFKGEEQLALIRDGDLQISQFAPTWANSFRFHPFVLESGEEGTFGGPFKKMEFLPGLRENEACLLVITDHWLLAYHPVHGKLLASAHLEDYKARCLCLWVAESGTWIVVGASLKSSPESLDSGGIFLFQFERGEDSECVLHRHSFSSVDLSVVALRPLSGKHLVVARALCGIELYRVSGNGILEPVPGSKAVTQGEVKDIQCCGVDTVIVGCVSVGVCVYHLNMATAELVLVQRERQSTLVTSLERFSPTRVIVTSMEGSIYGLQHGEVGGTNYEDLKSEFRFRLSEMPLQARIANLSLDSTTGQRGPVVVLLGILGTMTCLIPLDQEEHAALEYVQRHHTKSIPLLNNSHQEYRGNSPHCDLVIDGDLLVALTRSVSHDKETGTSLDTTRDQAFKILAKKFAQIQ